MSNGPRMPWGKYKGDYLSDINTGYIVWLLDNAKVSDPLLRRELAVEITRRMAEYIPGANPDGSVGDAGVHDDERRQARDSGPRPTPPVTPRAPQSYREEVALQVITAGYKAVAMKLHPDKGGSEVAMKELNSVREALTTLARRA
jgi:Putative quorum-sensing-regulated virulence factor